MCLKRKIDWSRRRAKCPWKHLLATVAEYLLELEANLTILSKPGSCSSRWWRRLYLKVVSPSSSTPKRHTHRSSRDSMSNTNSIISSNLSTIPKCNSLRVSNMKSHRAWTAQSMQIVTVQLGDLLKIRMRSITIAYRLRLVHLALRRFRFQPLNFPPIRLLTCYKFKMSKLLWKRKVHRKPTVGLKVSWHRSRPCYTSRKPSSLQLRTDKQLWVYARISSLSIPQSAR